MSKERKSQAKNLEEYSLVWAYANDGSLDSSEVAFMKRMALKDGIVDEEEKRVFRQIFWGLSSEQVSPDTWAEIQKFRKEYNI